MSTRTCTIQFDGRSLTGPADSPLIPFLRDHGIELPAVCYHGALGPLETCDTCWVSLNGEKVRGCSLKTADGMQLHSDHAELRHAREEGMDRLLAKHELYCTVCENNNGNCEIHNAVVQMDIPIQRYPHKPKPYAKDTSSPLYTYDPDQCILCGRCVEACQNVEVNETLSIDYTAEHPRVLWDGGKTIDESSCVKCGHCVTVCPCNALMENTMYGEAGQFSGMDDDIKRPLIDTIKAWENTMGARPITAVSEIDHAMREAEIKRTKTVCTYCGVGCSFEMWTRGRKILKVQPVEHAPANGISTCVKGKFGWDFVNHPDRLTHPLIRENGAFREASWDEALDLVARRLGEIRDTHGADAIGFIGSSKASNEDCYVTQKFARLVIGTNSVDNSSRYCQNPATKGLFRTVGYGGDAGSISDIEQAGLVIMVGSNTAEAHPVIASKIKRAQKLRGQKMIVADVRKQEMAQRADIFLRPRASTDVVWASAICRYILDNDLADWEFLEKRVNQLDAYRASLEPFTLEFAEQVTGIERQTLINAAEMIAGAKSVCLLWAMGVTQHSRGSDISTAMSNLLLVTGNYGKPGSGGYPMRGHNNVQGCSDFGCLKNIYPGYESVDDEAVRAKWAKGWGVDPEKLSLKVGLGNFDQVNAAAEGKVKAMYVIGEETAISDANANHVQKAFTNIDFLVVQDIFLSRTAEFADVVLPACPSVEKDGSFTNTERRIQRFYQVMQPLGESRPDWEILSDLARRMGHDWHYSHPGQIMAEAASIADMFAGVSYERLKGWKSQQWPVAADGTDSPLLYTERFHFDDGKARLFPLEWVEPKEQDDAAFDLMLDNGRMLEHFQSTNQSGKGGRILEGSSTWFVEIGPDLAAERGIEDGTWLRITSRRSTVEARAVVTDRVQGKTLFMPIHHAKPTLNALTGDHHDPEVNTPAYKETAVRIEKIDRPRGEPGLPYNNHRYGTRTPNDGPDAEQKRSQPRYTTPPDSMKQPETL
ncbi:formate dehydrogenase subunit alpha [Oleiagrimonas sp. C23AA]|uniref:formate dehydrogenase subunit alpha n=1 Tax=Oleiagrimonas sp. C23AA TaxID=2719047 RepID=UPI00141F4EF4|nr:formate dehydrogenase subunit alpha [Oleiagrimonas sp. C23AA]NII11214.1 formate dehydrogenase subunit alpha [Oleiagrimonas sp. C23AA]